MDALLLDTDILNEVLKRKNATVVSHASDYLVQFGQFTISSITRYEILRGLKEKQATTQLARFQMFCQRSLVLPVTDDILDIAADLWAEGRGQGLTAKDADLMIAATAIRHNLTLVTGNTGHFQWISRLPLENWRHP